MEQPRNYTSSIHYDRRLYKQDIAGSIAHVRMLARQKIVLEEEAESIVVGLEAIRREIESGDFPWREELEDIHMNVESRLFEKIGGHGRQAPYGAVAQRPGRARYADVRQGSGLSGSQRDRRVQGGPRQPGGGQRQRGNAGLYPPSAGTTRALRPPHAGILRDAGKGQTAVSSCLRKRRRAAARQRGSGWCAVPHRSGVRRAGAGVWRRLHQ